MYVAVWRAGMGDLQQAARVAIRDLVGQQLRIFLVVRPSAPQLSSCT